MARRLRRGILVVLATVAAAAPVWGMESRPAAEFRIQRVRQGSIQEGSGRRHLQPAKIDRGGDQGGFGRLPFAVGAFTGVYPFEFAVSQGVEGVLPAFMWFSFVGRVEGVLGDRFRGVAGEAGIRGTIPLDDPWALPATTPDFRLNFDLTIRGALVNYDSDVFDERGKTGQGKAWGPAVRAGFDYGGAVRVFFEVSGSLLWLRTESSGVITRPVLGFAVGIRFYFG